MLAGDPTEEPLLRPFGPTDVDQLVAAMDDCGVGVLRNVVPETLLAPMREYIGRELDSRDGQYFGLGGMEWIAQSPLEAVLRAPGFREIFGALYQHSMGTRPPSDRIMPVLRVLAGTHGLRHSNLFHYDSYVVTALVPILIPNRPDEPRGHLVMFPNLRHARTHAVVNVLEKALVENMAACRLWRAPAVQRRLGARIVPLEPGSIYFFWGMRSLHANQACLPTSVRSTALLHFGDPHEKSVLKHLSQRRHELALRWMDRK